MTDVLDLQEKLMDTAAAIARTEEALRSSPADFALGVSLTSLRQRQERLSEEFAEAASGKGLDVCSYRLFVEGKTPAAASISKALLGFQELVTSAYDAITNGPKKRFRPNAESLAATELGFGYAFSGSVGFVLTMSNERLLLGETRLDEAVTAVFEMAKARGTEDVLAFARKLGPATITRLFAWAHDQAEEGLGADIQWRRAEIVKSSIFVQAQELRHLEGLISATSDEEAQEFEIVGTLVGADLEGKTFHVKIEDAEDIRGDYGSGVATTQTLELPRRYKARIQKTTKTHWATGVQDEKYFLLALEPAD